MSTETAGWRISNFREAYAAGVSVADVIEHVLEALSAAPRGVLIGEPLRDRARRDVAALTAATSLDRPLYGVPFLVKDNIDVEGSVTSAGCPGYGVVAPEDATVVARLRAAGAIVCGRANMDQFATGLVGTRSPYGVPPNVIDPALAPGGSSSGSAIAVALGLVPFSLGTDTAGSGRVPAALNGIVGFKPTVGSVSMAGIVPAVRRFDCPSVFAHDVLDAVTVVDVLRGGDDRDQYSRELPPSRPMRTRPIVGVPIRWPKSLGTSDAVAEWFDRCRSRLCELDVEVREVDIEPLLQVGALLYGSAIVAERTAAVGDVVAAGIEGLDPIVATIIGAGAGPSAVDAYRAEYELARLRRIAERVWDEVDVLALPTTPDVATIEAIASEPFRENEKLGRLTSFVNLIDAMAVVVPLRETTGVEPFGLQLVAPGGQDREVARLAGAFEAGVLQVAAQECTVVVVGAHLRDMPLNHQLVERRATYLGPGRTCADYRLYALADAVPPKPGLVRVACGTGAPIDVELWSMGLAEFGSFVRSIPAPLGIGSIELIDGRVHCGFLCEAIATEGATDITDYGGWRTYQAARSMPPLARSAIS